MRTSTVFKIKVETPCPSCSSPRVGIDRDDVYQIVPGTDPCQTMCSCLSCVAPRGTYTEKEELFGKDCCSCGHRMRTDWYNRDQRDGRMECRSKTPYWDYARLAGNGCPDCAEIFSV